MFAWIVKSRRIFFHSPSQKGIKAYPRPPEGKGELIRLSNSAVGTYLWHVMGGGYRDNRGLDYAADVGCKWLWISGFAAITCRRHVPTGGCHFALG